MFPRSHAVRDLAIGLATLAVWQLDAAWRDAGGPASLVVACLAGGLTALVGYLLHEWGHLTAARLGGSVVHLPERASAVFLFQFDPERNTPRQFLAMSLGGYLASALVVLALLVWLPLSALSGQIALTLTALGVLATLVLELPPFFRVLRGGEIPRGAAYKSGPPGPASA